MNGFRSTGATIRRSKRRRAVAGIATTAAGLTLLVGSPAHATTSAPAGGTVSATAGVTWSQVMRRKLDLGAQSAQLTASLPTLRTAAIARNTDLTSAQATLTATAATLAAATAANQTAHLNYLTAQTAVTAAKKVVTAALKRKPASKTKVAAAQKALAAATATWNARATATGQAAAALKAATAAQTAAAQQLATATTAAQAATKAITDAQLKITATPTAVSTLAAQASTLGPVVVTQSRATFTIADTTKVYGITVNKIIAYPFQRMIDDAAAAGVPLSGGGFRTRQQQIALRVANGCPDIYTAPASSCRVPTAIPGRSLHELALAVDITYGGKAIGSHSSPAYKWLAANAGQYGFTNLPAEPWHWSITGN
jgi:D-alanyl-D-alanine carboxypeptidase